MQPGGYSGYDKGLSVLAKYGLTSEHTYRGRGALLCQTQQGLKMIRPYTGSADRLEKVYELLKHLQEAGHEQVDQFLRNEEGSLITVDKEGISYIVKDWWDDRECDARSGNDVWKAAKTLAQVHRDMYFPTVCQKETPVSAPKIENLCTTYRRRNQELKKIRDFIRKRKQKNSFEYMCLAHMSRYMKYGEETLQKLQKSSYEQMRQRDEEKGSVCHNTCTQHNFLMGKNGAVLVNYEHYCYDSHMSDLAQFMRKVLEKHGWSLQLAKKIISIYSEEYGMSEEEYQQLLIRLSYPEKFWKIVNYYYNNNKSFFSERNAVKLMQQMENEKNWLAFIECLDSK